MMLQREEQELQQEGQGLLGRGHMVQAAMQELLVLPLTRMAPLSPLLTARRGPLPMATRREQWPQEGRAKQLEEQRGLLLLVEELLGLVLQLLLVLLLLPLWLVALGQQQARPCNQREGSAAGEAPSMVLPACQPALQLHLGQLQVQLQALQAVALAACLDSSPAALRRQQALLSSLPVPAMLQEAQQPVEEEEQQLAAARQQGVSGGQRERCSGCSVTTPAVASGASCLLTWTSVSCPRLPGSAT